MKEICVFGRGGQGSLVLAQLMAIAALEDGRYGQAFPFLGGGGERKGKPIMAFCRLSNQPIRLRSRVDEPDYIIVQDATILKEIDVAKGLKDDGMILVNTNQDVFTLGLKGSFRVFTFSATELARKYLKQTMSNIAILGAFTSATRELSLDAVLEAIKKKFPPELSKKYVSFVRICYQDSQH